MMKDIKLKKHKLGFLQVDPLPAQSELNEYYENLYYQDSKSSTYQNEYLEEEISYITNKIEQKASILLKRNGTYKSLLDVGCGEGFVPAYFQKMGWQVAGIDFSDYGLIKFNPQLRPFFEKGDIYKIINHKISGHEKFDVIWLGNVLEHVLDPLDVLLKLKSLLNANGTLVITVPNDGSEYQEMLLGRNFVGRKWWIAYPDHLSYFTYGSLINICESAGYFHYELIADFPIDFFILHKGSNYIEDRTLGKEAHKARVLMENFVSQKPVDDVNRFYSAMAKLGLGRDMTIFLNP